MPTSVINIDDRISSVALAYVESHYDVKTLSVEEFYKAYCDAYNTLSTIWTKYGHS